MLDWICDLTGATSAHRKGRVQSLWSGYGEIVRIRLRGADVPSVIVKHIAPPREAAHPVGWATDRSHQRKLRSYEVERHWYAQWSPGCDARIPAFLGECAVDNGWLIALEDLDAAGFAARHRYLHDDQVDACLAWLAAFHARFLHADPTGLWPIGTYWHLDTRPDELQAIDHDEIRKAAPEIDRRLNAVVPQTLVHGDAKVANFCFGDAGVAAVDFQYVGGGCGMKDVAYFLGSCLDSDTLDATADHWLDRYFHHIAQHTDEDLQTPWRPMYAVAWADFIRFLAGWSPSHWKMDRHGIRLTRQVLDQLDR